MEGDVNQNERVLLNDSDERPRSAVNSTVLDYYKKFGRKRDLEQYFSLSTAQSEIRDPTSLFWRRMKEQSDTSDSGEKKSESSSEICRISIKCSIPDSYKPQKFDSPPKSDSESPPIITDAMPGPSCSGDDSADDDNSHKSMDATLDTSMNKPLSPSSSVTSQRKLEWDSLADVGYGNESDRKTSASSLSTLEREVLAQKQQYTLDSKQSSDLGLPTAHSTPVDPNDNKAKGKKGQGKKTMTFSKKEVDFVEVRMPENNNAQAINVNLTKQFSVNLDKDGGFTVDNVKKDVTVSPEKASVCKEESPQTKIDKIVQTSLLRKREKPQSSIEHTEMASPSVQKVPVLICLNTLRRRHRRKKMRVRRTKIKGKKKANTLKANSQEKDKSGEQVSEAESFEYMPGHMYNQNQLDDNAIRQDNNAGNKSSLESSAVQTTDSSKESKYSFTKDLEKSLDVLKSALKDKYDSDLKKKLVKEIIQRLLKSKYKNGDSTPDFLSVLSLTSKKTPTTSTSDPDNTGERVLHTKPKKSILRVSKFNSNDIASTSQSAPNLPSVVNNEKPIIPYLTELVSSPTTDTDTSAANSSTKENSSDTVFAKTSSEELYKKYIDALKIEEAYKQHLKNKERFLKQKLVRSDTVLKVPSQLDLKINNKLKELIKDLTRNNYDDGSGDASKLEGGSTSNFEMERRLMAKQRSHSVFTLSSGNSDFQNKKCTKYKEKKEISTSPRPGPSNCRQTINKPNMTDSSVQVSLKFTDNQEIKDVGVQKGRPKACGSPALTEEVKYVCLCSEKALVSQHHPDEFLIYKCSRLSGENPIHMVSKASNTTINTEQRTSPRKRNKTQANASREDTLQDCCLKKSSEPSSSKMSKSSQTNIKLASDTQQSSSAKSAESSSSSSEKRQIGDGLTRKKIDSSKNKCAGTCSRKPSNENIKIIQESTRCLQTEISIHPKISDPSVSDINVIKSADCVKLISELYRKISQSSSENACVCSNDKFDAKTNTSSRSSKDNIVFEDRCEEIFSADEDNNVPLINQPIEEEVVSQTCIGCYHEPPKQSENIADSNIVIPIQGTNMTLKVTIAGGSLKPQEKQDLLNTGVVTDKVENDEKFTSIAADCSKAVQSKNLADLKQTVVLASSCKYNSIEDNLKPQNNDNRSFTRTSYPDEGLKCNTYPKMLQINENKPLQRSNTSISNLGASSGVQTESNSDKEIQSCRPTFNQQEKSTTQDLISDYKVQSQNFKETLTSQSTSEKSHCDSERKSKSSNDKIISPKSERRKPKAETCSNLITDEGTPKDLILDMIQDITKRYSKTNIEKSSKKKCFKEIITVLNYLLDTDDSGESIVEEQGDTQSTEKSKSSNKQNHDSEIVCYQEAKNTILFNKALKINDVPPRKTSNSSSLEKNFQKSQKTGGKCALRSRNTSPEAEETDAAPICSKNMSGQGDSKTKRSIDTNASSNCSSSLEREISSSPKPTTSDKGCQCGCDESTECKEGSGRKCENTKVDKSDDQTLISKKRETEKKSSITSDKACGCGCDDFECDEKSDHKCKENIAEKDKSDAPFLKSKKQETNYDLPEKNDKACRCGCDNFECDENSDHKCKKNIADKEKSDAPFLKTKKQERNEDLPEKNDKACGCGCDDFECDKNSDHKCRKNIAHKDKSDEQNLKSKKQEANKGAPKTCDKACECGCDDLECKDSSDYHYKKNKRTEKRDNQFLRRTKKQELSRTSDKSCDVSSEYKESSEHECCEIKSDKQFSKSKKPERNGNSPKKLVSKCVQSTARRVKSMYCHRVDSSDVHISTDQPTASDSPTAKIINKIRKECEKYQKRCKSHCGHNVETSSSTTMNCDRCNRIHSCSCKGHKCRNHRSKTTMEKIQKKCVAYNLILQTSDSLISEENCFDDHRRPLPNIVVKVPKRRQENIPFKEMAAKIEQKFASCSPRCCPKSRSRSWPNEGISSTDDVKMAQANTVRDYLEKNRPDFVERCTTRQNCIKMISDSRASERSRQREVLSMQMGSLPTLTEDEMRHLAKQLGFGRRQPSQPKIISEKEMKKHSEKIYKSLPEVVQKKEDAKKESIKRTNLLMASIFKKNLQKKTLRGSVNLSNYSAIIKI
ncbi:uncharacterized protein isoform X1 [Choristoneura fumiferana]|uniref:uncharacterized protein isoform X1 n=1 Tax=Choristoneura fumiferana TaxID=7141 RepID=UPI003D15C93C